MQPRTLSRRRTTLVPTACPARPSGAVQVVRCGAITALAAALLAAGPVSAADAPPAVVVPGAPSLVVDEKGVILKQAGSPLVLRLKANIQADARKFIDDDARDNMLVRRVRPTIEGTVLDLVDFRVMPDFAGSSAVLFDAYLDIHPRPWLRLRVGKFKPPIGLERLQSDPDLPLMERALSSDLSPSRDVGVQLWGELAGGLLLYQLGVFDGAPDSANLIEDAGAGKDVAGRLLVSPFKPERLAWLGNLALGMAVTSGTRNGAAGASSLLPLRTVAQTPFFAYRAVTPDPMGLSVFADGRHSRLNPELYYFLGSFGVLADLIWSSQAVRRADDASARLTHSAGHVTVSHVVGGRNGWDGATPNFRWNPGDGYLGALQLALRYNWLKVDDDTFPLFANPDTAARQAAGVGAGATWVPSRMLSFAVNFEHTRFKGGAPAGGDRPDENAVMARTQINF